MALQETSLAPVVGVAPKNVQFAPTAQNLPRKILVVGNYDETTFTGVVENTPHLALSPEDVGSKTGFGFMLHRLVKKAFKGGQGVPVYWIAQPEDVAAVVADGSIQVVTTTTFTESGAIYLYVAGIRYVVPVASGETGDDFATAAVAIVNADKESPVLAAVNGVNTDQVDFTAKSKGLWGNDIDIDINLNFGELSPAGTTTVTITPMANGTTVGDIQDALDALGTGDEKNRDHYTELSHGYGQDTTTLDAISTYNGVGNDFVGLYAKTVARPFRSLNGDISSTLSTLTTLGDGRKLDRTNGIIATPGSPNHPAETAALATGIMALTNNNRAAESYLGKVLTGVLPPVTSQWTATYDNRDTAVRSGISPTTVEDGAVKMSSVLTFYHPDSVPVTSNGYRSMRNISILQNVLWNIKLNFSQEKWKGVSIVDNVINVTNANDRKKARDVSAVIDDLLALTRAFHAKAWIYSADFTIQKLQAGGLVVIRPGGIGFNSTLPILLSGEAGIFDTEVEFDTALDIVLAA
jgi:phage tail sheath gpL-like